MIRNLQFQEEKEIIDFISRNYNKDKACSYGKFDYKQVE
jgi:hypothetical protein